VYHNGAESYYATRGVPWLAKSLNFAQTAKFEFENGSSEKRKKFSQIYVRTSHSISENSSNGRNHNWWVSFDLPAEERLLAFLSVRMATIGSLCNSGAKHELFLIFERKKNLLDWEKHWQSAFEIAPFFPLGVDFANVAISVL
jgi:hypothetical protein